MNGNFRSQEIVKRYEYAYYDLQTPLNTNLEQIIDKLKIITYFFVDNSSEANPIDWYNSYIEVNFKLLQTDQDQDGAGIGAGTGNVNLFSSRTNGSAFIR